MHDDDIPDATDREAFIRGGMTESVGIVADMTQELAKRSGASRISASIHAWLSISSSSRAGMPRKRRDGRKSESGIELRQFRPLADS